MHKLFSVYFVKLYMFRAHLGPSSGGTTVCIQHTVFIILFIWLSVVLVHVSGASRPIIRRYNRMYTTYGIYYFLYDCLLCWYMFRAHLGPSSGGTTVCIQHMVLIILFRWLSVVLPTRTTELKPSEQLHSQPSEYLLQSRLFECYT